MTQRESRLSAPLVLIVLASTIGLGASAQDAGQAARTVRLLEAVDLKSPEGRLVVTSFRNGTLIDRREGANADPGRLKALRKVRIAEIYRLRSGPRDLLVATRGDQKFYVVRIQDEKVELLEDGVFKS